MCADPTRTFWGQDKLDVGIADNCIAHDFGNTHTSGTHFPDVLFHISGTMWCYIDGCLNNSFGATCTHDMSGNFMFNNARQLVANLRGAEPLPTMSEHIQWCDDIVPLEPNTFSDGVLPILPSTADS